MKKNIRKILEASISVKQALQHPRYIHLIEKIGKLLVTVLKNNHKILISGNGGSAADAQHFAAEIVNRFLIERQPLPAIALTTDSSVLTSVANDYGYEKVFEKQVLAIGQQEDVLIGITTSGNSLNIVNAMKTASKKRLITVGLLGGDGGKVKKFCDYSLIIPSKSTPRIQEAHITIIHILCQIIDEGFKK